jgi:hypothetical protein
MSSRAMSPAPPREARELAQFLGWFSLGLGALELFAGRSLSRWLGADGAADLVRGYGVREIATGAAILSSRQPAPWIWGRVAGDALDIATLGAALNRSRAKSNVGLALVAVLGVTALDLVCAQWLSARPASKRSYRSYAHRSGFPHGLARTWGAARDFVAPEDFRTPKLLRPFRP